MRAPLLDNLALAIESIDVVIAISFDWLLFSSKFTELCRAMHVLKEICWLRHFFSCQDEAAEQTHIVYHVGSLSTVVTCRRRRERRERRESKSTENKV